VRAVRASCDLNVYLVSSCVAAVEQGDTVNDDARKEEKKKERINKGHVRTSAPTPKFIPFRASIERGI
jgi:hypothetical protein